MTIKRNVRFPKELVFNLPLPQKQGMLDFPGDIGALLRGLTGLCSSSAIVVSFDLVVFHTKLRLALVAQFYVLLLAFSTKLSLNQVCNKDDVRNAHARFRTFS